ncbi:hypothetical protein AAL_00736 [Moelleriella libera RCEF 2490]|uniref:Uncharacterized protein n=1 Tax=Moelleriella libera RCEF 2490 TaxID=1081109 RepID=A0A166V4W0_9HYPO|nr:hypothetical protein AAL_00736 [Moelleriella libera RCEF 2490]
MNEDQCDTQSGEVSSTGALLAPKHRMIASPNSRSALVSRRRAEFSDKAVNEDESETMATCGSDWSRHDSDANYSSQDSRHSLDPQELLVFLHKIEREERMQRPQGAETNIRGGKSGVKQIEAANVPTTSSSRQDAILESVRMDAGSASQDDSDKTWGERAGSADKREFAAAAAAAPLSPEEQEPQSKAACEIPFRQPQLFVGRLAAGVGGLNPSHERTAPKQTHNKKRGRRRKDGRLDVRALPNHTDDPIDDDTVRGCSVQACNM